jgi:photosystem II stability/assembly factor-like uncharacterized protein
MRVLRLTLFLVVSTFAAAQSSASAKTPWQMQDSGTTASLRGIDSVDGTIAWASGTGGTILKTIDGGAHWQKCAVPDAEKEGATLDFRGVQAWDAQTAIVMASGKGKLSRLYKTIDGCQTWKLIFANPDKNGFWDAVVFSKPDFGTLIGDPVHGHFPIYYTANGGSKWQRMDDKKIFSIEECIFAASNSSLVVDSTRPKIYFVTGGGAAAAIEVDLNSDFPVCKKNCESIGYGSTMLARGKTAGAFSLAWDGDAKLPHFVTVGGDYEKPDSVQGTASFWMDDHRGNYWWQPAQTPPHGFRSAVQWSPALKLWITVGTNGSDISRDDGKTWQPLDNGNWNALSLPFVVGPNGRIARFNPEALPPITP